jgi:hypothetical protein
MKKIIFILVYIISCNFTSAQVQWAKQIYSNSSSFNEWGNIISDGNNNYMIGKFGSELYLPNDTLYASGMSEIFIAKLDGNGNNIWSKTLMDPSNTTEHGEYGYAAFDSVNQCIYLSGHFVNQITFPGLPTLFGYLDIFLAKMDLNGNFIWAKKAGGFGLSNDRAQVYVNPYGKIYLTAQSSDSCFYDNFHIGAGGAIVTYDTDGNCLSAEVKYNYNLVNQNFVFLDFMGKDIIYYGEYITSSFTLDTVSFTSMGDYDAFIARADSTGKIKWVHKIKSLGRETIDKISINNDYDIILTCAMQDSLNFAGNPLTANGYDILLSTLNENGNIKWVKKFNINSSNLSAGLGLNISSNQNIVLTGYFNGTADFGNLQMTSTSSVYDMFLAKFDTLGNCLSTFNFGKAAATSMTIDNNNNIYVGGGFFDNVSIGPINLNMQGYNFDLFLAKFDLATHSNTRTAPNNTLIIYANPNKGTCNITIPDDLKNSPNLTLMIYNSQGSLIQKQQIQQLQDKVKLSLDAEAKGMYNVTLTDGGKMYYGKIVFE